MGWSGFWNVTDLAIALWQNRRLVGGGADFDSWEVEAGTYL